MAHEFRLPDIGEGLTEAEVVSWLIAVGDTVEIDQNVVEVETDKAVVEIPIPFAGTVLHLGAGEGEVIQVGEVLIVVGEEGETYPASSAPPIVGSLSDEAEELRPSGARSMESGQTVKALPVVRKLARDLGVDLSAMSGSGPDGRIKREDVVAAAEAGGREPAIEGATATAPEPLEPEEVQPVESVPAPPAVALSESRGDQEEEPVRVGGNRTRLTKLRRTIARNMARSWTEIPHVTTFDDVDASRLLAARRALMSRHDIPVSIDAMAVKAVIPALKAYPEFNATLEGDELVKHDDIDMGVAVDTPDGLMVVVVRGVEGLGLIELSQRISRLAQGAKERSLAADQLTGQTFTVSNIGALGGGYGTPIVPPGTIGILSVGKAVERPIAKDGRVVVAPMMSLSLSYDHRVIDGGTGRRFMNMVLENLQEPALFLAS